MRPPKRAELTLIFGTILAVVSAVLAVRYWQSRGVCTDSVVTSVIFFLTVIGMILLAHRMYAAKRVHEESGRPVLLVMTSEPKKNEGEKPQIKGKMPDQTDH